MKLLFGAGLLAGALAVTAAVPHEDPASVDTRAAAGHPEWSVDGGHSSIGFSVRHFFTPVKGQFTAYEAELTFDAERPSESHVRVDIDASSVDTSHERRDSDLRSDNFFDVQTFPNITFESTMVEGVGGGQYNVTGMLTIRDVSRKVEMTVTTLGIQAMPENMQERFGSQVASFEAELTIDRRDFGVGSGRWTETTIVGADVEILLTIEAHHAAH